MNDEKITIDVLARRLNRKPDETKLLLESLKSLLAETVEQGDSVAISGFGSFEARRRLERIATNPATGKRMLVPPKISLVFKPSALLRQKVNESQRLRGINDNIKSDDI